MAGFYLFFASILIFTCAIMLKSSATQKSDEQEHSAQFRAVINELRVEAGEQLYKIPPSKWLLLGAGVKVALDTSSAKQCQISETLPTVRIAMHPVV